MNKMEFEKRLHSIASGMHYPPTPEVAGSVMTRLKDRGRPRFNSKKLAWSLTIIFVLVSSIMLVPPARAAIIEFIQVGVVRIFPRPAQPHLDVISPVTPDTELPSLISILDDIAGESNLTGAQEITPYLILLPAYPSDLGLPDRVYVQDAEGSMTILVWIDPHQPDDVILSLHFIPTGYWSINKMGPSMIQETRVNGQHAIWAEGPYPLLLRNGNVEFVRLIEGQVLIWTNDEITYRLETDLSLQEAIKIAESLQLIP